MAKQTAPIQEVARLLDLVPYISTHSHISVKELAEEFGITEKAMANELMSLSMCGLPGYTPYELIEVFFDTGFVTINNHDALDIPRALTNAEIASLLIGLTMMRESATGHTALIKKIDERRKFLVDPMNQQVKAINNYAKGLLEPLEEVEAHIKKELTKWEQELEKARLEAQWKAEQERRKAEAEAMAKAYAGQQGVCFLCNGG